MNIPMPILIPMFPFVKFEKRYSPNEYKKVISNDKDTQFYKDFMKLIKKNRDLLISNQVPLNKIRFTIQPCFIYDIDNDVVNPTYEMFLPLRKDGSGLFDNNAPVIELNKPKNLMLVNVRSYKVDDNYTFIKQMTKNSKKGVVIFIVDKKIDVMNGRQESYYSSVDSEILRIADLDMAIAEYESSKTILF
jgi:hypothetical protein